MLQRLFNITILFLTLNMAKPAGVSNKTSIVQPLSATAISDYVLINISRSQNNIETDEVTMSRLCFTANACHVTHVAVMLQS